MEPSLQNLQGIYTSFALYLCAFLVLSKAMTDNKKRLLTGLQSSGTLHIGNYFGALKPFVDMYQDYESFLMVADYHALTTLRDPKEMHDNIINVVKDYLAVGVDPKKCIIFRQSDNP